MKTELHRVVAGVSTTDAGAVVRWAAEEAASRHTGLRLLTALPAPAAPDRYLPNDVAEARRTAAATLHAELVDDLAVGWPDLPVATDLVSGSPAAVLRNAGEEADLLVVGADDASPFTEAIRGSVPGDLLSTAPCPLAVVPRKGWATPAFAPVVVALDASTSSHTALAYGYAEAERTSRRLKILRCVTDAEQSLGEDDLRLLMTFEELYPDVALATELVRGDPRQELVIASESAAQLVLGSRRRGRLASSLFGSVSRHLIRNGGCPVVVAHAQPVTPNSFALYS
jgi:nucleotide-binding universal stress UspA family protein